MSTRTRLVIAIVAFVVLAAIGVWWFFLKSDAPPPGSLDDAVVAATSTSAPTTGAASTPGAVRLDGDWVAGAGSFAGYRVREELATVGFTEAAGRTEDLVANLTFQNGVVTDITVRVDMQTLRSDNDRRDGALRTQALETDSFPEASFTLTDPIPLPASALEGTAFSLTARGDLTLHGVTRPVAVSLEAQMVDGTIAVIGSTEIRFADHAIDQPRSMVLLSVEDRGLMEFQLLFERE